MLSESCGRGEGAPPVVCRAKNEHARLGGGPAPGRIAFIAKECVACGVCEKECPFGAVKVYKGMYALVDGEKCAGCGKCAKACPAGVIRLVPRGVPA